MDHLALIYMQSSIYSNAFAESYFHAQNACYKFLDLS